MDCLPPEIIRLILLDKCDPRDAHYLANSCRYIRQCVTKEELHRFRCGVVRYSMLCRRFYWSRYPEQWNDRKECPYCHAIMHSQQRYDRHVKVCKILGLRQCRWCLIQQSARYHATQCPLNPEQKCDNAEHGFKECGYRGLNAQVEHHRKTCKLQCEKCGKRCSMRRAKYHGNIVSDRCDERIYVCPKCKQPWIGRNYGDHKPCLPDLDFHRPGSGSSVS